MKRLLCGFGMVCLLFSMTGCSIVVEGAPQAAPKCTVFGFEDLRQSDPECGVTVQTPFEVPEWSLRYVDIGERTIMYLIRMTGDEPVVMIIDNTIELRPYAYAAVFAVERTQYFDVVTVYASDVCLVERFYDDPQADIGCIVETIGARQLSKAEALTVLPQTIVDGIEDTAFSSGRVARYMLSVAVPDAP